MQELKNKVAVIVGGGQTPGATVGNGRATSLLFAREGATVIVADRNLPSAEETVAAIEQEGGTAFSVELNVEDEAQVREVIRGVLDRHGRIDVLHFNVGIGVGAGDALITEIDLDTFDRIQGVNLRGAVAVLKHVLPVMQDQGSGAVVCIGSLASVTQYPYISYKTSKAGLVALVENVARHQAPFNIRCNAILPGYMDTPMAIEAHVDKGERSREEIYADRGSKVPLGGQQGTAWDTAEAALFLASDRSKFVTGVALKVDGGQSLLVG